MVFLPPSQNNGCVCQCISHLKFLLDGIAFRNELGVAVPFPASKRTVIAFVSYGFVVVYLCHRVDEQ
jgi:hypothetical protein